MVIGFSTTFSNSLVILGLSVLLVGQSGVPRENHKPAASPGLTLSQHVVSITPRLDGIQTHNLSGDMY
jgi:hypothetical protein